jgi:hypothetical protein
MAQINKPSEYFNTKLYTGTSATNSVTGVGFQPDFVWIKDRDRVTYHFLFNAISGATNWLATNTTGAEQTFADTLTSFNSDGFTLGTNGDVNGSPYNFVGWSWKANGAGVSNTDGSITSTVSASTTSGFSIVSFTGTGAVPVTVGHGLGVVPEVLIIKNRTNAYNWAVYHKELGNTGGLFLNTTSAFTTNADLFNNTSPTNLVVTFSNSTLTNQGSANHIMYAFNSVKGFSKFGSYTGNSSTNGTFVYTGFKPAFVLLKATTNTNEWWLYDNKRNSFNPEFNRLAPNNSTAEYTTPNTMDFLSNGFKLRDPDDAWNATGNTYIYMAFAENPLVGTNNIPTTAR